MRDRGKNLDASALNVVQRFRERFLVAGIELNVISRTIGFKADGFANYKRDGFSFCLADALRALGAAFLLMEQWVRYFMRQSGELLGGSLAGKQRDFSGRALPLRGINRFGVFKLDAASQNEALQPFSVSSGVALGIRKFGKRFTVGVG